MKLRYVNNYLIIFLIYIAGIFFFECLFLFSNFISFLVVFVILTLFIIFLFVLEFHDNKKYTKMKKGIKKCGYIIGGYYRIVGHRQRSYCLKFILDGKIFLISKIANNKAYKKFISDLKNVSVESEGVFRVKKIPVDIYIDGDEYFADLDSIKMD